jgi:hypothetical protein
MRSNLWRTLFILGLLGAMGLELLGERIPPQEVWDYALFFALTGLLGCLILSFLAKGVLAPALDRREDYYGDADAEYDWSTESPAAREAGSAPDGPATAGRKGAPGGTPNGGQGSREGSTRGEG